MRVTSNQSNHLRISFACQFLLAIYFQCINWFSLGGWNDQPGFVPLVDSIRSGRIEWNSICIVGAFLLPFLLFLFAYWRGWPWLLWTGVIGYTCWLCLQIQTWWIPYIFGASDHWHEVYHRVFAHTTKLLPSFGNHLAPDGMHLTIQLLLIIIVASTIIGLIQMKRNTRS